MTRDQTSAHSTISLEKLAKRVANAVCHFLDVSLSNMFCHSNGSLTVRQVVAQVQCRDPAWQVGGPNGIKKDNVILIGLVHVSQGSWQPILQLDRYIITRSPHVPELPYAAIEPSASHSRMRA
jgi:hypothetical protein